MPSFLQIENISKSYGPKILFEHIGFNINEGDKIALIAPNGTGKTSLLRILAGKDKSDSGGKIIFLKDIRIAFLEQEYGYDPELSIWDQVVSHSEPLLKTRSQEQIWDFEILLRKLLTGFNLADSSRKMGELSGGEVKRVALAEMLAGEADFYIMDEPTNHLDLDAVEFLESYLGHARCTLLMVTHDRYFLDRVCNTVMELDHGAVYVYRGNYQNFLEKRDERIANYNAETDKVRNILRRELEWIHATPCARTGKAKYRIDAFHELKERAAKAYTTRSVDLSELQSSSVPRLGNKIVNCRDVSFRYGDHCYLDHFTYNFQRFERVGIAGANGAGKTTFINLLTGSYTPDMVCEDAAEYESNPAGRGLLEGVIDRGESIRVGYYRQGGIEFDPDDTVLDIVNDTHLLNRFMFGHDMLNNKVSKLSGGEKRRLYLLTVLMTNPNVLVLDEPTNDLDVVTINILEEYLKEFTGTLIIVSHDRHFMDRLVDHMLVFCGNGVVKDFLGNCSEYRSWLKDYRAAEKSSAASGAKPSSFAKASAYEQSGSAEKGSAQPRGQKPSKKKLTWKEERELESLEAELEALAEEKSTLEESLSSGTLDFTALRKASERVSEIISLSEEKELRWLELSCR
ncbi:MAG: ABC-F family ATP-binding cassette domain-containing protein [Bacteroidales bacterium]|nr:ABC-F family ATP-binding cassette domain-containing protein [Bacteroidales bacterium]